MTNFALDQPETMFSWEPVGIYIWRMPQKATKSFADIYKMGI